MQPHFEHKHNKYVQTHQFYDDKNIFVQYLLQTALGDLWPRLSGSLRCQDIDAAVFRTQGGVNATFRQYSFKSNALWFCSCFGSDRISVSHMSVFPLIFDLHAVFKLFSSWCVKLLGNVLLNFISRNVLRSSLYRCRKRNLHHGI